MSRTWQRNRGPTRLPVERSFSSQGLSRLGHPIAENQNRFVHKAGVKKPLARNAAGVQHREWSGHRMEASKSQIANLSPDEARLSGRSDEAVIAYGPAISAVDPPNLRCLRLYGVISNRRAMSEEGEHEGWFRPG